MDELSTRIADLSPEKRLLLELMRKEKRSRNASAQAAPRPARSSGANSTYPFCLVSEEDRLKMPEGIEDAYPLSMMQAGMIYHMELTPDYPLYHNVDSARLQVRFFPGPLQEAVQRVVARHPILRTSFDMTTYSEPLQLVHKRALLPIQVEDISGLSFARQEQIIDEYVAREKKNRFDMAVPPLLRFHIHVRSESTIQFTLTEFHPILDGWSLNLTIAEIFKHYNALLNGEPVPYEPPPSMTYRDFVSQELAVLKSEECKRYWAEKLSDCNVLELPQWPQSFKSREGKPVKTLHIPFSARVLDGLKHITRSEAVPLKTVLLAAHVKVMSLLAGQRKVLTGLTIHGRPEGRDGDEVRGVFFNTVPFCLSLPQGTWTDLVRATFKAECELMPFRRYPVALLQRERGRKTLLETGFNITHYHLYESRFAKESLSELKPLAGGPKRELEENEFPLYATFNINHTSSEFLLMLECHTDKLCDEQINAIIGYYTGALEAMATDPHAKHDARCLLSHREQQQILVEWNDTRADFPRDARIHDLIEQQVERTPHALAAVSGNVFLSYSQLNERANQLAHYLRRLGVGPESLVAIFMERSIDMVVSLLAIGKAGGAYLPLDPSYPPERIEFMLSDASAQVIVCQQEFAGRLPRHDARLVVMDSQRREFAQFPTENPRPSSGPDSLAYLIYTSGSTGKPKGVQITHRAVINFLTAMARQPGISSEDTMLWLTTLSFDIAGLELWLPLISGAKLLITSSAQAKDPLALGEIIDSSCPTVIQATPATWNMLFSAGWRPSSKIKLLSGGESLNPQLAAQLLAASPAVWNLYGPTETTIWSCVDELSPEDDLISIGRPIANTRIYILDESLQPVPTGVAGELYIAGDGLARGYYNAADLTASRFLPDPFSARGERIYRTGDLARWLPDGRIEIIGRADQQVKLRGYRIELGEIEAVLRQHPAVAEAVVVARGEGSSDKKLVAYVAGENDRRASSHELREHLKRSLPEYMLPSAIVVLDRMPLTPNGKIDRRALPEPDATPFDSENGYVPPRTPTQAIVSEICAEILGVEKVGIYDSFFDLGGHSLSATQFILRLRHTFNLELSLRLLFESPTVAGLAEAIEAAHVQGLSLQAPPLEPVSRSGPVPLSFNQEQLWFLNQLEPDSAAYNIPAAIRLKGELNASALERTLNEIARRHEVLRTTFSIIDGQPLQIISPPQPRALQVTDLSKLPEREREAETLRYLAEEAGRGFDLSDGPLLRVALLRLAEQEHVLAFTMHHIIGDAWSIGVLVSEVTALYQAFSKGEESPLEELRIQYADFASWQRKWMKGAALDEQLNYWKGQLEGIKGSLNLPTDRPRSEAHSYHSVIHSFELPASLAASMREMSRKQKVTPFMVLLAAFKALLYIYTKDEEIVIGSPIANRNRVEVEKLIGFFANTLVLRSDLSGNPTMQELLERVAEVCLGAYAHQELPFDKLVRELQPERKLGRTPFFQVAFTLQNVPMPKLELEGIVLEPIRMDGGKTPFDLILNLTETPSGLQGSLEYNTGLFDAGRIKVMADDLEMLLAVVVTRPEARIRELAQMIEQAEGRRQMEKEASYEKARAQGLLKLRRKSFAGSQVKVEA